MQLMVLGSEFVKSASDDQETFQFNQNIIVTFFIGVRGLDSSDEQPLRNL